MRWRPTLLLIGVACLSAACQSTAVEETAAIGAVDGGQPAATVGVSGASGGVALGPATASVGVGSATLVTPSVPPPQLVGVWRLAPSGDRSCTVDLGPANRIGETPARTRGCGDVALSRVALWSGSADAIVLYDLNRSALVSLRQESPGLYQGQLFDGRTITVWR